MIIHFSNNRQINQTEKGYNKKCQNILTKCLFDGIIIVSNKHKFK